MKSGGIIKYLSAARLSTRVEGAASAGQRLNGRYNKVTRKTTPVGRKVYLLTHVPASSYWS